MAKKKLLGQIGTSICFGVYFGICKACADALQLHSSDRKHFFNFSNSIAKVKENWR